MRKEEWKKWILKEEELRKPIICESEIKKNIVNVDLGKPLTKPLRLLNDNCEFREHYLKSMDRMYGRYEKGYEKARRRKYCQRLEVKKKMKEYGKEYSQRPEVKKKIKEYNQRPEVKKRLKEKYEKEN